MGAPWSGGAWGEGGPQGQGWGHPLSGERQGSGLRRKPSCCPPWLGAAPRLPPARVPLCFLTLPQSVFSCSSLASGLIVARCPWAHPAPTPGSGLTRSASWGATLVPSSLSALCPPAPPTACLHCTLGPQRPPSTTGLPPACRVPPLWLGLAGGGSGRRSAGRGREGGQGLSTPPARGCGGHSLSS